MAIEVRATKPDEYRAASNTVATALMFQPHDDESWERSRPSWDESSSRQAWDGDRCVGPRRPVLRRHDRARRRPCADRRRHARRRAADPPPPAAWRRR